jgi:hypothetical protein
VKTLHRNVTISLPVHLVRKAKLAAAREDSSLSAWVARQLAGVLEGDDAYRRAMRIAMQHLQSPLRGPRVRLAPGWRDEAHER